jgi:hypothetical protein
VIHSNAAVSSWPTSRATISTRQPGTDLQPTFAAAGLSGRPAVIFNADDVLLLPSGFADFSRGISLFAVAALAPDVDPCVGLVHLSNGTEIDDIELGRDQARGAYEVQEGVLSGPDFPLGRAQLISVVHDPDRSASIRFNAGAPVVAMFDLPSGHPRSNLLAAANMRTAHGRMAAWATAYHRAR